MELVRFKDTVIFKIGKKREHHLRTHISDLYLAAHEPQRFDRACAVCAAITDKTGGLVVPLGKEEIDRVFKRG